MDLLKHIESIIEGPLSARGYTLVRAQVSGANRKVLQLMVERIDDVPLSVDDCSAVSRLVSVLLDVQDPIKDPYILEVSSPGLERPLVKPQDFKRFCQNLIVASTYQSIQGRKQFQGRLIAADNNEIMLDLLQAASAEPSQVVIELANIRKAHLLIEFNGSETRFKVKDQHGVQS